MKKIYKSLSGAKQALLAVALTVFSGTTHSQATYTFMYTGGAQTVNLQAGTYSIECWGADGGNAVDGTSSMSGGKGGYATGVFTNSTSTVFNIYVGEHGGNASGNNVGGGGGGMSDIAPASNTTAVIIVAAGGGGAAAGSSSESSDGGLGGGLTGGTAQDGSGVSGGTAATGGSQSAGGFATAGSYGAGTPGGFGYGGGGANGGSDGVMHGPGGAGGYGGNGGWNGGGGGSTTSSGNEHAGGGGAGYYGGGGGRGDGGAGGGGSSYIGGVTSATTIMFGQSGFVPNPDVAGNGLVIITSLCEVAAFASNTSICEGAAVTLSTNAATNISWSTGSTASSLTVSPQTTTSYSVTGTGTSNCVSTAVITVSVNPLPVVSGLSFPALLCAGQAATLFANGAANYTWHPGGVSASSVAVNPSATTVFTLTGESEFGCVSTETINVPIDDAPLPVSGNTTICKGQPAYLSASGGKSYQWSNSAPFANIVVYPTVTTNYFVQALNSNNCINTNSLTVTVEDLPQVNVSAENDVLCKGEIIELTGHGADSYAWSGGGTGNTYTQVALIDITQTYTVTGTGSNGCTNTATINIRVDACLGLDENAIQRLALAPNPATDQVRIVTEKISGNIFIRDLSGRLVYSAPITGSGHDVDVQELPPGVYFVEVSDQNSRQVVRLVKQ